MKYLSIILFVFPLTACAGQQIECPTSLAVEKSATPPSGWQTFVGAAPHSLERVGFYSGDPGDGASLIPDATEEKQQESQDEWQFDVVDSERTWLACIYVGTDVFLARQLDASTTKCNVTYKTTKSGSRISVLNVLCD